MAEENFTTTNEGGRQENPPTICVGICLMCRKAEVPVGESLCPECERMRASVKSICHKDKLQLIRDFQELKNLAAEIRGLAKSIKAGEVPAASRVKRIARDLGAWEHNFKWFVHMELLPHTILEERIKDTDEPILYEMVKDSHYKFVKGS
jgi:hypothetical protein